MTPDEFVPNVVDVGPDEDLRFTPYPGGTADESATIAGQLTSGIDGYLGKLEKNLPQSTEATEETQPKVPRVRVKKPEPTRETAFDDLMAFLSHLPEHLPEKTRTFRVLGHRVAWNHRRDIARMAGMAMLEHMSSWEFARVVQQGGYGLEAYMQTLKEIRDNRGAEAKDRMAAADKLLQLFGVFMSGMAQDVVPKTAPETAGNLMQILVDVRGEGEPHVANQLPEETGLPALGDTNACD